VSSVYVEEFGREISKDEIYQITVVDVMMCSIEVDWRDFFPYLGWIANRSSYHEIQANRSYAGLGPSTADKNCAWRGDTNALKVCCKWSLCLWIFLTNKVFDAQTRMSYLDFLVAEKTELTDEQLTMLVWEELTEAADTTLVATQ
jgi:ent-kaurene oxidase